MKTIIRLEAKQEVIVTDKNGKGTISSSEEIARALDFYRRKNKKALLKSK